MEGASKAPAAKQPTPRQGNKRRPSKDSNQSDGSFDEHAAARVQLNTAITFIGPGPYQLIVLCLGGGVYMAEGSLLLMLSVIAKSLIIRWKLSALFAGAMVSIIFAGLLVGTMLGGSMSDRYGRRMPILVTYFGMTVFLCASVMSPDLLFLITVKFMLGMSLGFGVPAANAIVCESCPASHRSNVYSMTMVLFSLGQLYSASVLWAMSPEIDHYEMHWRGMLALAAMLPLVLGSLSFFFLLESPHWLLSQRRFSEAREVVMIMAQYKGTLPDELIEDFTDDMQTPAVSPQVLHRLVDGEAMADEPEPEEPWSVYCAAKCTALYIAFQDDMNRLGQLFSEKFFLTTVLMSYISFVSNFAYYGMIYGLPDTLKDAQSNGHSEGISPAAGVFMSAAFEIPGVFIAIILGTTVGRKMNMTIGFGGTALSLGAVVWVLQSGRLANAGLIAVFSVKLWIASVFIIVYLYLLECYPTKFRATGLAFCMVIGRLGAFVCPFLFDGLIILGYPRTVFFIIMGILVLVAATVSFFLPYETKDSQLMEDEAPTNTVEVLSTSDACEILSARGYMRPRSNSWTEDQADKYANMSAAQKKSKVKRMQSA